MKSILLKILCLGITLLVSGHLIAQIMDEPGLLDDDKSVEVKDLFPKSTKEVKLDFDIPPNRNSFGFDLILNNNGGALKVQMTMEDVRGSKEFTVHSEGQTMMQTPKKTGIAMPNENYSNHVLVFTSKDFTIRYFVFPCFLRYTPEEVYKNIARWDETIPNSLQKKIRIDLQLEEQRANGSMKNPVPHVPNCDVKPEMKIKEWYELELYVYRDAFDSFLIRPDGTKERLIKSPLNPGAAVEPGLYFSGKAEVEWIKSYLLPEPKQE